MLDRLFNRVREAHNGPPSQPPRLRGRRANYGREGWRIGLTKPTIEIRKARRRRQNTIAKASRAANR